MSSVAYYALFFFKYNAKNKKRILAKMAKMHGLWMDGSV